ncbi:MAG: putative DNA binding domain-containing protein [Bacteroidales bacterium]|nr:putative DNA binding domain-containing protein [Bacteroidales bacterium]
MTEERALQIIKTGETASIEFKRCGNGIQKDTYETVCAFLNRFGGELFLGVEDDGNISGIPENAVAQTIKNFVNITTNPAMFNPIVCINPEVLELKGKKVLYIRVIPSSEVHKYKNVVYDRAGDADIKVSTTNDIAQMYIRKQNIFTEKRIYKYVKPEHLRLDLLPMCRQRAVNKRFDHPWKNMNDMELLRSAKLYSEDFSTGEKGFNLAAVMLLGRDEVIGSIVSAYKTDAILRVRNLDRYDDRLIVNTNLVESFDLLMGFAQKHLWDKFYLDEYQHNVSVRDKIAREMLANTLIHREFTSPYIAKFIIEKDRMYTENACRAARYGIITPENLDPIPKNPIIASFFNQIGNADELGSGTRNLFKYTQIYSAKNPELFEDDIFRSSVPLDFEEGKVSVRINDVNLVNETNDNNNVQLSDIQQKIITLMSDNPQISYTEIANNLKKSRSIIATQISSLLKLGIIKHEGSKKTGYWYISIP